MCCDGTLFHWAALDEETHGFALRRQLPVVQHEGRPALLQPCAALDDSGRCQIYDDRPPSCFEYRCKVYRGVEEGVLEPEQARAKIARARAQSHRLYQHLGVGRVGLRAIKNLIAEEQGSAAWRRDHGELLMDLVAFMRLGQIDFGTKLPSAETRFSVDDPEGPPPGAQQP